MVSTGIEALDARLGTLIEGRDYIFVGPSGVGKTSAALHFLGAGLEAGEICAILSQDDPSDLIAHADHLGYDFRHALANDRLRALRFRLDFLRNYSRVFDPALVFAELDSVLGEPRPSRLVIDSLLPFLDGGPYVDDLVDGLAHFLAEFPGTVYLTVPTELGEIVYRRIYHRIASSAAGIFELRFLEGRGRECSIQKLRQPALYTDPFRFVIRPGVGIVEEGSWDMPDNLPDAVRRRVVVLEAGGELPADLGATLERKYELVTHDSLERAFADLANGQYGVLLICLDPLHPEPIFHLTQSLRRAGTGAPILILSPSERLRSSTRARLLRLGADDLLTDALSPQEVLERIEGSRLRGHRRMVAVSGPEPLQLQPADDGGILRIMSVAELRTVVRQRVESDADPFFVLAVLDPGELGVLGAWDLLRERIRVREGDLLAALPGGRIGVFLHDLYHEQGTDLVERFAEVHPALGEGSVLALYRHPADHEQVLEWLEADDALIGGTPAQL